MESLYRSTCAALCGGMAMKPSAHMALAQSLALWNLPFLPFALLLALPLLSHSSREMNACADVIPKQSTSISLLH